MKRRLLSAIFLSSLILSGLLSLPGEFCAAGATATVYIRADGSVDPSTAPVQRVQDLYTFYGDINASLVVQRDSIIVDGAGHTLKGGGNGTGVDLTGRSNVTVRNLVITGFQNGAYLSFSYNNTLSNNNITANTGNGIQSDRFNDCSGNIIANNSITKNDEGILLNPHTQYSRITDNYIASNNDDGIYLYATGYDTLLGNNVTANKGVGISLIWTGNTTLRSNSMTQNRYNFGIDATYLDWSVSCDVDASNTVDGRPIYHWINKHDVAVPSDAGYIALINCDNITVKGLNLTNNSEGVLLALTENCTITQNNIANDQLGLSLISSPNSTVTFNNVTGNDLYAIQASDSAANYVCYNNITGSPGVSADVSFDGNGSNNVFSYNNLTYSNVWFLANPNSDVSHNSIVGGGLNFHGTSNATICYNNVSSSPTDGIDLDLSSNNIISHNSIEANLYNGVYLTYSSNGNNITNNRIANNNADGLQLVFSSDNNLVSDNDITGNGFHAVLLVLGSANNVFTRNSFVNNTSSVGTASAGTNIWDSGYPSGGNFWSDYSGTDVHSGPNQNGTGSDGLGDTAYIIDPNNVDNYPLMKPYAGSHDLGVKVSVSKTVVPEGYNRTISMNVTVINYGVQAETFNFTYQIGSALQEQTVTLTQRNSTLFVLSFNVTGWSKGNYTLYCQASPVPGETDTSDNTYQGLFIVSILGDINGDCNVDMRDVGYVARRFQIGPTSPLWNPNADINDDLKIDMKDIGTVARHFGESWL